MEERGTKGEGVGGHGGSGRREGAWRGDATVDSLEAIFQFLLLHHEVTDESDPQSLQQLHVLTTDLVQQNPIAIADRRT